MIKKYSQLKLAAKPNKDTTDYVEFYQDGKFIQKKTFEDFLKSEKVPNHLINSKTPKEIIKIWNEKMKELGSKIEAKENFYTDRLFQKKADFSGDFANIPDIAPDPGNSNPGFNNEIVKQQTDFFPHKTSDSDNGEFVHTHPDNCPRPDLRKLKVVNPDESESEFSKPEK